MPDFWADALSSDSAVEDAALLAALQDCGGLVVYGDLPVTADAKEARQVDLLYLFLPV